MTCKPQLHDDSPPELSPFIQMKCRQMAGRFAVTVFLLAFVGLYIYGIVGYGVFLGIALGWLPAGFMVGGTLYCLHCRQLSAACGYEAKVNWANPVCQQELANILFIKKLS